MSKELTIESFNEILFGALKDNAKKSELIAKELIMAYKIKIEAMEELVTKLNGGLPYHNELQKVNNIDASLDKLGNLLNEAEQEEKENERRYRTGEESWHRGSVVAKKK